LPDGSRTGWSAPSTIRIEGGNVGIQIGAGETDVVFVVMNDRGMDRLLQDEFIVGTDAAVMAGPVGRSAAVESDATLRAEILSYSRSRDVLAGVALNGATLRPDNEDHREMYGRPVTQAEILHGKVTAPPEAMALYKELNDYAGPTRP
jgi:lipid-binding SYLF domain-containing protein